MPAFPTPVVSGDVWGGALMAALAVAHNTTTGDPKVPSYTKAALPSSPDAYQIAHVTDGAIRGPHIWIPSQGWKDLVGGVARAEFFGAKFDGTTDDTTALQTALDELGNISVPTLKLQNASGTFQAGSAAPGAGVLELPHGTAMISTLTLRHRPMIRGKGDGTVLRQIAATTGPMITNQRDGTRHAGYIRLRDFQLDGNKASQTAANHGIYIKGDTTNTYNSPLDEDYDVRCRVTDVYVRHTKGSGVYLEGAGGNFLRGVFTRNCDQYGIYAFQDNDIDHCETAWSGLAGLLIAGDSCRVTNHKSWYSGQISVSPGIHVTADSGVLAAVAAQDNTGAGFLFENAYSWSCAGIECDDNDTSGGDYPAIDLWNSAFIVLTPGHARNRYSGSNAQGRQNIVLRHRGGSDYNEIRVAGSRKANGWGVDLALTSDSTVNSSKLFVNGNAVTPGATV